MSSSKVSKCVKSLAKLGNRNTSTSAIAQAWYHSDDKIVGGHSSMIANRPEVFEIVVDDVKPKYWEDYLKHQEELLNIINGVKNQKADHIASFKFIAGDVNFRAMHLFKYRDGWTDVDACRDSLRKNGMYQKASQEGRKYIFQQSSKHMKSFSFWPFPDIRDGHNIYDVRSYILKPGYMYDWSCYWKKGLACRQEVRDDTAYAGLFTQLGTLNSIYHIWCYKDLADRNTCRQATWKNPEWNQVVSGTVPLIKSLRSRLLEPLSFSPTK